ncbi:MAG: excinuclease ABC subunit UvrA [Armatimonadota bacterium]|nr:excinuclease ABC subunit UvrA [Armatimonadota bacterium]MDR7452087.1 excinuclease ABC subunit UvrA [Armatimonadota bacterium]MDR7466549.1 excinuclease ABC subunit UvrA [Armatimonadota bacterium]MDR7493271.1 excinuclease ABC subunit UvrA [Armatimonadota bacterium]MDR7499836.1 excinuclease ABC subunit UvrA [Armatimonadota bacterium]
MPLDKIVVRGAREHNLKNITVEIPRDKFVVLTGISGSGKSSLAFDTIYAEGQRKYVESLSAYARQFLGLMEKPDVDHIDGLSPAVSIDQKGAPRNPRSTVGTVTEIYDYLRLLYARIGQPHCPVCDRLISRQSREQIVERILALPEGARIQVLGPVVRGRKGEYRQLFEDLRRQGFARVRVDGIVYELGEEIPLDKNKKHWIEVVVDRIVVRPDVKARLADSLETALKLGQGMVYVDVLEEHPGGEERKGRPRRAHEDPTEGLMIFSQLFACPEHGSVLPEIEPRVFSFNSPYGACPTCSGLGFRQEFDADLVLDWDKSLSDGAVVPWANSTSEYYYELLQSLAAHYKVDMKTPLRRLPRAFIDVLLHGSAQEFRVRYHNRWGALRVYETRFEGVLRQLERRYRETDSEYLREEYEQYMTTLPCPSCRGARLKKESLSVRVGGKNIAELTALTVRQALDFFHALTLSERERLIAHQILKEIKARLGFLVNVGLDYLTLDRTATTLSGGEAQRIRLATQIGSGLMGVLYVLDEPSIGLHQRDNRRLIDTLMSLRDLGNTILVVEHDEETIRSADWVVDIGPGAGAQGGHIVVTGPPEAIAAHPQSLTGQYLSGRRVIPIPPRRRTSNGNALVVRGAREHNLKNIDVRFPLGVFIAVTGVSGSGKSTLVDEILYRALAARLHGARLRPGAHLRLEGVEHLDKVINIDQSPIGRTPRSNPATYTKTFDLIRELFAQTPDARMRGFGPGRFSFNVRGGRCEACEGDGIVRIEMHFLPDVYVPCEVCKGSRYNRETLEVLFKGKSIADVLEMTVAEALQFFEHIPRLRRKLQTLFDVGLGYIKLGQPATTLSGGEAQRVKLAAELSRRDTGKTFYILDEPTVGLHFADVERLLQVLHRLVDAGNTVVVIEHNLDVIKTADWVIDLGPEGGDLGGQVIAEGPPEAVAEVPHSYTGQFLRRVLASTPELVLAGNGRRRNGRVAGRRR